MKNLRILPILLISNACISAPPDSAPDFDGNQVDMSEETDMPADSPPDMAADMREADMPPPQESCEDGILNQSETDIDCGGPCAPCGLDLDCETDADCRSGSCQDVCVIQPECVADPELVTLDVIPDTCTVIGLSPGVYDGHRYERSVELVGMGPGVFLGRMEFVGSAETTFRMSDLSVDCDVATCATPDLGGGVYHIGGALYLDTIIFGGNFARQEGGSIYSNDGGQQGSLYINASIFDNASATIGGNIFVQNTGPFYMRNSLSKIGFVDNNGSRGGGLYIAQGNATILDSNFEENQVGRDSEPTQDTLSGGAIYFAPPNPSDKLEIIDSGFLENQIVAQSQGRGGAVFVTNGHLEVRGSLFMDNVVRAKQAQGGAIAALDAKVTIINSSFIDNEARAAIDESGLYGGALWVSGASEVGIQNSTFSRNHLNSNEQTNVAMEGGAVYIDATFTDFRSVSFAESFPTSLPSVQVMGPATIENVFFGSHTQPDFSAPEFLPLNLMTGQGSLENVRYTEDLAKFYVADLDYTIPAPTVSEKVICHGLDGERLLVDQLGSPRDTCTPGAVQ